MSDERKIELIGRAAAESDRENGEAKEPEMETVKTVLQGTRVQTVVGPAWGIAITVPSSLIGKPIEIFCEARNGTFHVMGKRRKIAVKIGDEEVVKPEKGGA